MGTVKRNKQKGGKASGKLLTGVLTVIVAVCVSVYDFITGVLQYKNDLQRLQTIPCKLYEYIY